MLRILFIDDHSLFREILIPTLKSLSPEVTVYQADSICAGLKLLDTVTQVDLVLLDLYFPNEQSWQHFPFENAASENIPVVILTASAHTSDVKIAQEKGCKGFMTKSISQQEFVKGITRVLSGHSYFSTYSMSAGKTNKQLPETGHHESHTEVNSLSKRQNEILIQLTQGKTNREIAKQCGISEGTVKLHVSNILKVLQVSNRTQAVIKAHKIMSNRNG